MLFAVLGCAATRASAQARSAVIVSGATGGQEYAAQYATWSRQLARTLTDNYQFDLSAVTVLSEAADPANTATAANVRRVLAALRGRMAHDDILLLVLIGHGTFDGIDAKFNLVGPDLDSAEWAGLLGPLPGQVVVVDTTSASFPFMERLAGPRHIVITATDSAAQRFDTVFPEYFVRALGDAASDIDKNERISVWEAFSAATAAVRRHYQQRGQLATERPLLDDDGDGKGADGAGQGTDGSYASRTYLDEVHPGARPTDEVLLRLLQRKAAIGAELDDLKVRKTFLAPADYAKEFERLVTELARVSHDIRARTGS